MCPAKCTLPTKFCLVEYDVTNPNCNLRNHVVSQAGTDHDASHRGSRAQVPVNTAYRNALVQAKHAPPNTIEQPDGKVTLVWREPSDDLRSVPAHL